MLVEGSECGFDAQGLMAHAQTLAATVTDRRWFEDQS